MELTFFERVGLCGAYAENGQSLPISFASFISSFLLSWLGLKMAATGTNSSTCSETQVDRPEFSFDPAPNFSRTPHVRLPRLLL
jgi:hypothetical protein